MFGKKLRQRMYDFLSDLYKVLNKIDDSNKKTLALMYFADIVKNLTALFLLFDIKDERFNKFLENLNEENEKG